MRVAFKNDNTSTLNTIMFAEVDKVFYFPDDKKVLIHTIDDATYISCDEIEYDNYVEMKDNLLSYGFLDLSNNSFCFYN